jgi:hypothetical protein
MSDKLRKMDDSIKNVGVILCGGNVDINKLERGRRGCDCDHMVVGFTTAYALSITTNVLSSIPTQARCTRFNM